MFYNSLLPYEIPIMDTFIKFKVRTMVSIIYKDCNGYIPRVEAPYLIRYFLQSPSQSQVVDEILPAIEKLESSTDKPKGLLEVEAFETYLITMLKSNQYEGYDRETLIEAFRILDTEKNGYLDLHTFYTFLKRYGISFTKEQIDEMEKYLNENENEMLESLGVKDDAKIKSKPTTTRKFFYENYVRKVKADDQAHFDSIYKEYKEFYEAYQETKKFPEMPQLVVIKEETAQDNKMEEDKKDEKEPEKDEKEPEKEEEKKGTTDEEKKITTEEEKKGTTEEEKKVSSEEEN